jgi:hypothetical protein
MRQYVLKTSRRSFRCSVFDDYLGDDLWYLEPDWVARSFNAHISCLLVSNERRSRLLAPNDEPLSPLLLLS